MVFHGALREVVSMKGTLCQRRGHAARMAAVCLEVGGWQCGDLQEALGVSWAWEASGQAAATWGKDMRVIHGVGTIRTVEW